ncbi:MAG: hypothetical protein AMXMBFR59_36090 [Rhodanobacteraceae bacterium]
MEVLIDLFIPEDELDGISGLKETMVEWGGESFAQDPARFDWNGLVSFTRRDAPAHILRSVSKVLPVHDLVFLSVDNGVVTAWIDAVNSRNDEVEDCIGLKECLLAVLANVSRWACVFDCEGDDVGNLVKQAPRELVQNIEAMMDWNRTASGFIAWNSKINTPGSADTHCSAVCDPAPLDI